MNDKPEFFWSAPDGAPIIGMAQYEGVIVIATASGVYIVKGQHRHFNDWTVERIEADARRVLTAEDFKSWQAEFRGDV